MQADDVEVLAAYKQTFILGEDSFAYDGNVAASLFKTGDISFAVSPVLVCKHPLRTVGLGDAISSIGLTTHLKPI